jgi:phosphocarrier protein HPr
MTLDPELIEKTIVIGNELGLHARVATALVKTMKQHSCQVTLAKDGMEVDARSVLGLLLLAATPGAELMIRAHGPGSLDAVRQISELLETNDSDYRR